MQLVPGGGRKAWNESIDGAGSLGKEVRHMLEESKRG